MQRFPTQPTIDDEISPRPVDGRGSESSRAGLAYGCLHLRTLRITEHIDPYQLHGFDAATPIEERLIVLDDLLRQGHVRYIGVSNSAAWHVTKALGLSALTNLRRSKRIIRSPAAVSSPTPFRCRQAKASGCWPRAYHDIDAHQALALQKNVSVAQLAVGWLLHQTHK